ncbi:hypothetical protein ACQPZF_05735 [Actinosynnema sp. CS-041913]|uniref:hypothetical protein n=1 Tax=Actinosynnema sp. CS-041913 TaxID=3239917 RepID=UPI003D8AF069
MNDEQLLQLQRVVTDIVQEQLKPIVENMATKDDINRLEARIDNVRNELKSDIAGVQLQVEQVGSELKRDIKHVEAKLDTIHEASADTVQGHENRIARLERRVA